MIQEPETLTRLLNQEKETARALLAALTAERARADTLARFIADRGYRRCDVPACNCPSYHGGHAEARLDELTRALEDAGIDWQGSANVVDVEPLP